jgi:uncharacterized protein
VEDESKALWAFVKGGDFASSEPVMAEVPRALKREPGADPAFDLAIALGQAWVVLSMTTVRSVDSLILFRAAAFEEPNLGSLDAIHVVTALALRPIRAFVSYDKQQLRAARRAGLWTVSPGAR